MVITSFLVFLLIFVLIGVASSFKSKKSNEDYLLAGQDVKPWLAALSAVATNNSGYMFIGMIGYAYTSGLQCIWLMIGWITGDFIMSLFVHKPLRQMSEKRKILSFGGVISDWHGFNFKKLRILAGFVTVIFLGVYAAAQFKAGSKALHVLFNWDISTGAIIGSVIVFAYCLSGGIRASIWTDAAQSFVMIVAMAMLFVYGVNAVGGLSEFHSQLAVLQDGKFLSFWPTGLSIQNGGGIFLFILGWFFAGFGVIGQPHIMIRFMTVDNTDNMRRTKTYYYTWFVAFWALTILVGLASRLIMPPEAFGAGISGVSEFDPELALPLMSQKLLPQILIGVVLAGIFSSTMSTADSQILSCSAAVTSDILPHKKLPLLATKFVTALVTLIALGIALWGPSSVFDLVTMAWSMLAAAFGPLLIVNVFGGRANERLSIAMVLAAILVTYLWRYVFEFSSSFYECGAGIIVGLLVYAIFARTPVNCQAKLQEVKFD